MSLSVLRWDLKYGNLIVMMWVVLSTSGGLYELNIYAASEVNCRHHMVNLGPNAEVPHVNPHECCYVKEGVIGTASNSLYENAQQWPVIYKLHDSFSPSKCNFDWDAAMTDRMVDVFASAREGVRSNA